MFYLIQISEILFFIFLKKQLKPHIKATMQTPSIWNTGLILNFGLFEPKEVKKLLRFYNLLISLLRDFFFIHYTFESLNLIFFQEFLSFVFLSNQRIFTTINNVMLTWVLTLIEWDLGLNLNDCSTGLTLQKFLFK
jgi:hypothetical protein